MRQLTYSLAINEALHQMMDVDPGVFVIGQGSIAHGMWGIQLKVSLNVLGRRE
jgi:pyruvate/2-oxoglutarate/acetoin dehydrogenase E1 component